MFPCNDPNRGWKRKYDYVSSFFIVWDWLIRYPMSLQYYYTYRKLKTFSNKWKNLYVCVRPCLLGAATKREGGVEYRFSDNSFENINVPKWSHAASYTRSDNNLNNDFNTNDWIIEDNDPRCSMVFLLHYLQWNYWKGKNMISSVNSSHSVKPAILIQVSMKATMDVAPPRPNGT